MFYSTKAIIQINKMKQTPFATNFYDVIKKTHCFHELCENIENNLKVIKIDISNFDSLTTEEKVSQNQIISWIINKLAIEHRSKFLIELLHDNCFPFDSVFFDSLIFGQQDSFSFDIIQWFIDWCYPFNTDDEELINELQNIQSLLNIPYIIDNSIKDKQLHITTKISPSVYNAKQSEQDVVVKFVKISKEVQIYRILYHIPNPFFIKPLDIFYTIPITGITQLSVVMIMNNQGYPFNHKRTKDILPSLSLHQKHSLVKQAAQALLYLHTTCFVYHCSFKPENILMDENLNTYVIGLSNIRPVYESQWFYHDLMCLCFFYIFVFGCGVIYIPFAFNKHCFDLKTICKMFCVNKKKIPKDIKDNLQYLFLICQQFLNKNCDISIDKKKELLINFINSL